MQYLKALVGAAIAGLGSAATAVTDGHVTAAEWIAIASTTLVALYGVWQVPGVRPAAVGNGGEAAERLATPSNVTKVGGYPGGLVPPTTTSTSGNVKVVNTGEQGGVPPPSQ